MVLTCSFSLLISKWRKKHHWGAKYWCLYDIIW